MEKEKDKMQPPNSMCETHTQNEATEICFDCKKLICKEDQGHSQHQVMDFERSKAKILKIHSEEMDKIQKEIDQPQEAETPEEKQKMEELESLVIRRLFDKDPACQEIHKKMKEFEQKEKKLQDLTKNLEELLQEVDKEEDIDLTKHMQMLKTLGEKDNVEDVKMEETKEILSKGLLDKMPTPKDVYDEISKILEEEKKWKQNITEIKKILKDIDTQGIIEFTVGLCKGVNSSIQKNIAILRDLKKPKIQYNRCAQCKSTRHRISYIFECGHEVCEACVDDIIMRAASIDMYFYCPICILQKALSAILPAKCNCRIDPLKYREVNPKPFVKNNKDSLIDWPKCGHNMSLSHSEIVGIYRDEAVKFFNADMSMKDIKQLYRDYDVSFFWLNKKVNLEELFPALEGSKGLKNVIMSGVLTTYEEILLVGKFLKFNPNIERINLKNCNIKEKASAEIIKCIKDQGGLKYVDLCDNIFGGMNNPVEIYNDLVMSSSLQHLFINNFNINEKGAEYIGMGVTRSKKLQSLYISDNNIGDAGAEYIGDGVARSNSIQTLDISSNNITEVGIDFVANGIARSKSMLMLCSNYNNIGKKGAESIGDSIGRSNTLQVLNINSSNIGAKGAESIGMGIGKSITMRILSIRGNNLLEEGAQYIGESIGNSSSMRTLDISNNNIKDKGAEFIGIGIGKSKTMQALNISNNKIEESGAEFIGNGIGNSGSMQLLDISSNKISDKGAEFLGIGITKSNTMQTLYVFSNTINEEGAKHIGVGISKSLTMQALNIRDNKISDMGAQSIMEGIGESPKMQALNIMNNAIGEQGAEFIGINIAKSKSLQNLCIRDKEIGEKGAQAIAKGIAANKTLQILEISESNISDAGAESIVAAIENTRSIKTLNIFSCNKISPEKHDLISSRLAKIGTSVC